MLEGGTVSTVKRVCVLLSMLGGGTATISILNRVLMSIFGGGATISIFNCVCAHVHAWRWHSDTAIISILNCVCVLMSMLISTLKHVLMSMLGGGIATIFILTRERVCVRMSMLGVA